jgi:hypothetical protein
MGALITLPEYAKGMDKSDQARPIVEMFAQSSDILEVLPVETVAGGIYQGHREAVLPQLAFRGINEGSTSGHGTISPFQEGTYIMDHDIDVDRAIIDRNGTDRRTYEEKMGITAAGRLWVDTFVKGDQSSNPRVFNGLQVRAAKFSRTQHNSSANGGAALSLAKLDTAINNTSRPTHILAPFNSRPLWIAAARNSTLSGFVMQTWDDIGKLKISYAGLPFLWGYPKDDHAPVLDFNEVASGGGAAVTASLYVLSLGEGMFRGIQVIPLQARDIGLLQDGKTYRTHLAWDTGLVDEHKYCITRLDSWTNAPIAA